MVHAPAQLSLLTGLLRLLISRKMLHSSYPSTGESGINCDTLIKEKQAKSNTSNYTAGCKLSTVIRIMYLLNIVIKIYVF